MSEGLTGALVVLVPLLVAALAYLGTRGSTRVSRQAAIDTASDRLIDQLQEEVSSLRALVVELRSEIDQLRRERTA